MILFRPLALSALVVLASGFARAAEPVADTACARDAALAQRPPVRVITPPWTVRIRHDLTSAAIARMQGHDTRKEPRGVHGEFDVTHRLRYKADIVVVPAKRGRPRCAWLSGLTVNMTPTRAEIFVPSEYPVGSCEYEQVLAHERLHEKTHREVLTEASANVARWLAASGELPAEGTPIRVADRPEANRLITRTVNRVAKPMWDSYVALLETRQKKFDSAANYERVVLACSNW